jgi:Flp pilus assembly protein TadD
MQQALAVEPRNERVLNNLGMALRGLGREADALAAFQRSLAINPQAPTTLMNLGALLLQHGRGEDGLAVLRQAVDCAGTNPEPYNALANALSQLRRVGEAEQTYRAALQISPNNPRLLFNLANLYLKADRVEDAEATYRAAIAADPDYFDPYHNLGHAYTELGEHEKAAACFRKGVQLRPGDFNPHMSLGMALMALGEYREGWVEYQWRLKDHAQLPPRDFAKPRWNGEALQGRTLLLASEQGAGDTLMFMRYLPMLKARGVKVVVECLPPLKRLFENQPEKYPVFVKGEKLPPFDFYIAPIDLPLIFGTTVDTIPNQVPYLAAPTVEQLPSIRLPRGKNKRIGVIWNGNPVQRHNAYRSIPLELMRPLFDVPGCDFYSLQYGATQTELERAGVADRLQLLGDDRIVDFWGLAGLMQQMDLIVSVCTGPCHLAGALGLKTWTLLRFSAEWRWLSKRDDSPWYPSMRLFRQARRGDWPELVSRVAEALRSEAAA